MNGMNPRVVLPFAVLGLCLVGAVIIMATGSPVAGTPNERPLRAVRTVTVAMRTVNLEVESQGTVSPRTESELIPEVSGRVLWTSPSLVSGGYFDEGEPLLRLDRVDLEASVERARAALSRARGEYAHAKSTLARQEKLAKQNVVSPAALDDARRSSRVNSANLREAKVALEQAERDLERSEILAPFSGRVREEHVDVGQFVSRGQHVATLYATDAVEVRLPIADAQLAYLDLPLWQRHAVPEDQLPEVVLSAHFAGKSHEWRGRVLRTEGEIDAKSRFVNVVARVENDGGADQTPLPVGLFVKAKIQGKQASNVAVIPRAGLQEGDQVFLIDPDDRLRIRDVDVLRIEQDEVFVRAGLAEADRVCVSTVQVPVDGMQVQPVVSEPAVSEPVVSEPAS